MEKGRGFTPAFFIFSQKDKKEEGPVSRLIQAKQPAPATGRHPGFCNLGRRRLGVSSYCYEGESDRTINLESPKEAANEQRSLNPNRS